MSGQGAASNKNGSSFQNKMMGLLANAGADVKKEVKSGVISPIGKEIRYDLVADGMNIECKNFSGMPGTIWHKIFGEMWFRKDCGPVFFVVGNGITNEQYMCLKYYAKDHVPNITILKEKELLNEYRKWTSDKPGQGQERLLSHR